MKTKKLKTLERKIRNWIFNHKLYLDNYEKLSNSNKFQNFMIEWENAYIEAKKENSDLNYTFGDMIC
jgi:hypothetical protein